MTAPFEPRHKPAFDLKGAPPQRVEESPVRQRARQRAERAERMRHAPLLPPLWVALGAMVVPALLIFSGFFLKRAVGEAFGPNDTLAIVTATPPPRLIVPVPVEKWLSATAPANSTPTPGKPAPGFFPSFASATPGFTLNTSYIVYVCFVDGSDEICLMDGDGQNVRRLTRNAKATDWYPSISPDGRLILFSSQMQGNFDLYAMDLNGDNVQRITHNLGGEAYAPSLNLDAVRLVFASTASGSQNIWMVNRDGTGLRQLTFDSRDNVDPVWSPEGGRISFTTTRHGEGDLMIMNADGSNQRRVTHGINVEGRNSWSPDGQYLAFYAGPQGNKDIWIVQTACANLPDGCGPEAMRQLTAGGNNKAPDFSPDGQWIVFTSQLEGTNQIFVIRVDGSEFHQLTSGGAANWQPRWGWSP